MVRAVWLRALCADDQGCTWHPGAPSTIPRIRDGVKQKAWFCGPPAEGLSRESDRSAGTPGLRDFMIHWAGRTVAGRVQAISCVGSARDDAGVLGSETCCGVARHREGHHAARRSTSLDSISPSWRPREHGFITQSVGDSVLRPGCLLVGTVTSHCGRFIACQTNSARCRTLATRRASESRSAPKRSTPAAKPAEHV